MGNFLNSLFGSSQSSTYQPPAILQNTITDLLTRAGTQSQQPYPQYTPDTAAQYSQYNPGLVAPFTPNQAQAGQSIAGLQGYTQPNFQAATGLAAAATNPLQMQQFSQNSINQYMNPYLNNVVGSAVANINQTNAQQQQQALGSAIGQGAYGGDRAGIAQAELARQQNLANNATISNLLGQGYNQAQQMFTQQQGVDLATQLQNRNLMSQGALNLANLGTQGQQAALQQAQAQYGYGSAEQQQQQAGLSTAYQQYLNQQMYPYQQLGWYAQLASGTAPSLGGTSTMYSPTISNAGLLSGGLGTLGALANPGSTSNNPFATALSGLGNFVSGAGSAASSLFPAFKDGGRAEYADAGSVPVSPVTQAYNDYNDAVNAGAPYDVLQQLYQKYQKSFQGATPPWQPTTPTAVTAPTATTPPAPGVAAAVTGGHGGQDQGGVTARNAQYSPDYTSSNGPVGGGGYGPYDAGGGSGTAFNPGGPLGGLISGIAAKLEGTTNVNKTPYDPNYTGVVSSMGEPPTYSGLVDGLTANTQDQRQINQITDPLAGGADLAARKDYNTDASSGLLAAIAAQESGGIKNPNTAVGDGGAALGQFQMHNPAARQAATELGLNYDSSMRADPNVAPALAQQYLSDMFNYTGTIPGAIAAYNMGPGAYKAAVQAGQDPTQGAYTQGVLGTGLVDVNRGIMPPGPAPLPPERPASMDVQQSSPESLPSQAPGAVEAGRGDNSQSRDTSGDRANIYSAPIGPGLISQGETLNAASRDTEGGEGGEGGGGNNARGGLIRAHHYATGGFTPIAMQYGMPSEKDIQTRAQDFAGAGVGSLSPQLQALAAKGVLGSAKGGRIHAADGAAISPNLSGFGGGSTTPGADENYNLAGVDDSSDDSYASWVAKKLGIGPWKGGFSVPQISPSGLPASYEERTKDQNVSKSDPSKADDFSGTVPPRSDSRGAVLPMTPEQIAKMDNPGGNPIMNPNEAYYSRRSPLTGKLLAPVVSNLSRVANPNEAYESEKDQKQQPIIPETTQSAKTAPIQPKITDSSNILGLPADTENATDNSPVKEADMPAVNAAPAQSASLPPYIAPPPRDINQMNTLNFFARLMAPGAFTSNLANAADAYAKGMVTQNEQERATMKAQAEAEQQRAAAFSARQTGMATGTRQTDLGNIVSTIDENGQITQRMLPFLTEPGQTYSTANGGKFTVLGNATGPLGVPTTTAPIPTGKPGFESSDMSDESNYIQKVAREDLMKNGPYPTLSANAKEAFESQIKAQRQKAAAAQDAKSDLSTLFRAAADMGDLKEGDFSGGGPLAQERQRLANAVMSTLSYAELKDDLKIDPTLAITDRDITSDQLMRKVARLAAVAKSHGNEAASSLLETANAFPASEQTPTARATILASLAAGGQRELDRLKTMTEYGQASRGYGMNMQDTINKLHPTAKYNAEKQAMVDLMGNTQETDPIDPDNPDGPKRRENAITRLIDLSHTDKKDEAVKQINDYVWKKYHVKNFARNFVE